MISASSSEVVPRLARGADGSEQPPAARPTNVVAPALTLDEQLPVVDERPPTHGEPERARFLSRAMAGGPPICLVPRQRTRHPGPDPEPPGVSDFDAKGTSIGPSTVPRCSAHAI